MFHCLMVVVGVVVYPLVNAWQKAVMFAFDIAALFFLSDAMMIRAQRKAASQPLSLACG